MKTIIAIFFMIPMIALAQSLSLPIECGSDQDLENMLKEFKEEPAISMITRRMGNLSSQPLSIETTIYVNFETKTWTIIEHFPDEKTHCIITSGEDMVPAVSLYKDKTS